MLDDVVLDDSNKILEFVEDIRVVIRTRELFSSYPGCIHRNRCTCVGITGPTDSSLVVENVGQGY